MMWRVTCPSRTGLCARVLLAVLAVLLERSRLILRCPVLSGGGVSRFSDACASRARSDLQRCLTFCEVRSWVPTDPGERGSRLAVKEGSVVLPP